MVVSSRDNFDFVHKSSSQLLKLVISVLHIPITYGPLVSIERLVVW